MFQLKRRYGRKAMTFCFRKLVLFILGLGLTTPYSFGYFGLKFLPDVLHCVYWVFAEIWAPDSSHKIGNKFFIHHCQDWKEGSLVCETVWFFSWANTHPLDLKFVAFCPKFSGYSYVKFWENTISGEFFRNFVQTKAIIYRNLWNFALLSETLFWVRTALKKFTQVLSYVVCTQVRRHVHKKITNRRYGGEKPGRFIFEKPVLFTLGLGLTTPYSLGILVWNFYQTFFTVSTEFLLRFEPQIRPTSLAINFLFFTARTERKVRFCVKLFDFFRWWILILWPKICRVWFQIEWRFLRGISGKNYFGRIFQKFSANQGYPLPKLVKFRPTFCNFILGPYCTEKFTQLLSYVVCTQVRRHMHKQITKRRYRKENQDVCFRNTSFVHSRSRTYYALLLGYFGLNFLPDCVYWDFAETWSPESSPKIGNKFLSITTKAERKVRLCEIVW